MDMQGKLQNPKEKQLIRSWRRVPPEISNEIDIKEIRKC
jgi:hypothetical protein